MSDRLDITRKWVESFMSIIKESGGVPMIDPSTGLVQMMYLSEATIDRLLEIMEDRWMYTDIEEGQVGLSDKLAKETGAPQIQTTKDNPTLGILQELFRLHRYYSQDDGSWLQDLGMDEESPRE